MPPFVFVTMNSRCGSHHRLIIIDLPILRHPSFVAPRYQHHWLIDHVARPDLKEGIHLQRDMQ